MVTDQPGHIRVHVPITIEPPLPYALLPPTFTIAVTITYILVITGYPFNTRINSTETVTVNAEV